MPSSITSRGKTFFAPQVVVDTRNELVNPGALGKSVAIFGDFPQLQQNKVHTFRADSLGVGDLYPKVSRLRNLEKLYRLPFEGAEPATAFSVINVATTAQASHAFNTADFKSKQYGVYGNSVSFILEDPDTLNGAGGLSITTDEYYRLRVKAPGFNDNNEFIVTAGAADQLEVTYEDDQGGQNDCVITIADGVMNVAFDAVDEDFDLSSFSTNDDLAASITAIDPRISVEAVNFTHVPSELDEGTFTLTDNANASVTLGLHAHTAALFRVVNNLEQGSDFPFKMELDAVTGDASTFRHEIIDGDPNVVAGYDANKIVLSGGSSSSAAASDYLTCFQLVDVINKDFTSVTVESTSATVHGYLSTYLEDSAAYQKERNGYVPAPVNQTLAQYFSLYSRPLNDKRISVVIQGAKYKDFLGAVTAGTTDLAVADMAFLLMCMQGSLSPAVPITGKTPKIVDTVQSYDRDSIQDKNLVAKYSLLGVALDSNNNLTVIRGLTSWRKDNLIQNTEISGLESVDSSSRDLRAFITSELGTQITNGSKKRLQSLVTQRLGVQRDKGVIRNFANVTVSIANDTATVDYEIAITDPLNFISVTATIGDGQ